VRVAQGKAFGHLTRDTEYTMKKKMKQRGAGPLGGTAATLGGDRWAPVVGWSDLRGPSRCQRATMSYGALTTIFGIVLQQLTSRPSRSTLSSSERGAGGTRCEWCEDVDGRRAGKLDWS
jgi:hypothetical protein